MWQFVTDIPAEEWKRLIEASEVATYFQTPECCGFYEELSFLEPFKYGVLDAEGRLLAVICGYVAAEGGWLKRWFSRRAIVSGGVMCADECGDEALEYLLSQTRKALSRKVIYVEVRNYNDYAERVDAFARAGFRYVPHLNIHVDVDGEEAMLARVAAPKQRQIRAAEGRGVEAMVTREAADVEAFYALLAEVYRTKARVPLFPQEFFEKLVGRPEARLVVTREQGRVTGGMMIVELAGRTAYEWFVCGDVMATWGGLRLASELGVERFDFMGAGRPDVPYGVREFKRHFGGRLVEHGRFLSVCRPVLYKLGVAYVKMRRGW